MTSTNDTTEETPAGNQDGQHLHLTPAGARKTGDVEMLHYEAELAEQGEHGGNPAKPTDAETAKNAIEKIENAGLVPAWRAMNEGDSR